MFDDDADPTLRKQILTYHLSGTLTDRERARLLGLPHGCRIRENAKIICPENLRMGEHVYVGEGTLLEASAGLEVGHDTQFCAYAIVYTHSTIQQALAGETNRSKEKISRAPTRIGPNCWIGSFSVIYPGVTLGERVVVLPLSVVNKDVQDGEVVGGAPLGKLQELEKRIQEVSTELEALKRNQA